MFSERTREVWTLLVQACKARPAQALLTLMLSCIFMCYLVYLDSMKLAVPNETRIIIQSFIRWFTMTAELVFGGVFIAVMVTGFLEKNGNYHAWNDTVRVVRSGRFSWVIPIAIIFAIVNVILTSLTLGAASSATEPASVDTSAVTEPSMLGRMILAMMIGMVIAVKMYFVKYFSVRAFGSLIGAQGGFYQPSSIQNKLDQENYGKVFLEGAIPILILTMLIFAFTNIGLLTLTAISGIAWLAYISAVIRHSQGDRPKVKEKVTEGKYAFNS